MLFGFVLGGAYLWIMLQVWKAGKRGNFFSPSHDSVMFGRYRALAKAGHVPMWPLYLYWAALIGSAALAVGLFATFH
jgi:hypothetical protein